MLTALLATVAPSQVRAQESADISPLAHGSGETASPVALTVNETISFDLASLTPEKKPETELPDSVGPSIVVDTDSPAAIDPDRYRSLGNRMAAAKWETLGLFAYITATQAYWTDDTTSFHFKDEGWFGKNTNNLGIDKLTHAFNAYLFAEFLGARIARKTGDRAAAALPAALLSTALQFYGEL